MRLKTSKANLLQVECVCEGTVYCKKNPSFNSGGLGARGIEIQEQATPQCCNGSTITREMEGGLRTPLHSRAVLKEKKNEKKTVRNTNRKERHGQDMDRTEYHRNSIEQWLGVDSGWQSAVGGWWRLEVGGWWVLGGCP